MEEDEQKMGEARGRGGKERERHFCRFAEKRELSDMGEHIFHVSQVRLAAMACIGPFFLAAQREERKGR